METVVVVVVLLWLLLLSLSLSLLLSSSLSFSLSLSPLSQSLSSLLSLSLSLSLLFSVDLRATVSVITSFGQLLQFLNFVALSFAALFKRKCPWKALRRANRGLFDIIFKWENLNNWSEFSAQTVVTFTNMLIVTIQWIPWQELEFEANIHAEFEVACEFNHARLNWLAMEWVLSEGYCVVCLIRYFAGKVHSHWTKEKYFTAVRNLQLSVYNVSEIKRYGN